MKLKFPNQCVFLTNLSREFASSPKFPYKNIAPETIPNIFQGFGKKPQPFATKNVKITNFFLSKKFHDSASETQKIIMQMETSLKENTKFSSKNLMNNFLDFYTKQLTGDNSKKFEILNTLNKICKENIQNLAFSLQNAPQIHDIIGSLINFISLCEYFEYTKKITWIKILQEFLDIVFKSLETEVYKNIHNKNTQQSNNK